MLMHVHINFTGVNFITKQSCDESFHTVWHHACTMHGQIDARRCLAKTARKPGILRSRVPQRCMTLLDIGIDVNHPRSAAKAAQKRRRRPRVLLTAYAPRCSGSTLDTLQRCQRPRSANPADLWLVLDAASTESEGTVVLNVIVTHTRSRNTCNVKAVGWRST